MQLIQEKIKNKFISIKAYIASNQLLHPKTLPFSLASKICSPSIIFSKSKTLILIHHHQWRKPSSTTHNSLKTQLNSTLIFCTKPFSYQFSYCFFHYSLHKPLISSITKQSTPQVGSSCNSSSLESRSLTGFSANETMKPEKKRDRLNPITNQITCSRMWHDCFKYHRFLMMIRITRLQPGRTTRFRHGIRSITEGNPLLLLLKIQMMLQQSKSLCFCLFAA